MNPSFEIWWSSSNSGMCFFQRELAVKFPETDHLSVDLIPQAESDGLEAAEEPQFRGLLEEWVRVMAAFQVIIWNLWIQVVNVMESNVA